MPTQLPATIRQGEIVAGDGRITLPTATVVLERARSLCSEACFTVALQRRRLRSAEPEDDKFIFRWWADLQFLIVALRRLQRAAQIATHVPEVHLQVIEAITEFKASLPGLDTLRNIGEHIDEYAVDSPKRHDISIDRRGLQVGTWDGTTFSWLNQQLNIDTAMLAAEKLFLAVKRASGGNQVPA
jgi:hypothetical protein